jgi:hypothetical protein
MNRRPSKPRFNSIPGISLLLALGLTACWSAAAAQSGLRPYIASYDLYSSGMHVAITELRLERREDHWRWRMLTRARGIYAIFTDKEPFSETSFSLAGESMLLREIRLSDYGDDRHYETARFDWDDGRLRVLRKGKSWEVGLSGGVYDYQSIHLLAAAMGREQLQASTVDFYRKGKLVKSRLVYSGRETVDIDGRKFDTDVYEQVVTRSNGKVRYYYDTEHPLLPLRVERLESGESPSVMTLREVSWDL